MKIEQRREYLNKLLFDAQRCRSKLLESIGNDEASLAVLEDLEPWLFGKKCIIEPLRKCIDGEPSDSDVINFATVAKMSPNLTVSVAISKRKDPTIEEVLA